MRGSWFFSAALWIGLCAAALLMVGGCQLIGFVAATIPQSVDAQYKGLAKQKVAVLVWADRGTRIDFPNLQLDLGNGVQANLIAKANESSLKGSQFPWESRSVLRFQREHPELEGRAVTEWAHRLSGITRLIFIEVPEFSTRSGTAIQLLKGGMTANVKVLEIGASQSKIVYERQNVQVTYPPKVKEGVVDVPEIAIYSGTVNEMALTIAKLFYPYAIED